ncbi:MAG: hypothetical protein ACI8PZ_004440 [Myxococcota bacterium]|jgi:hypothetical protein
MAFNFSCPKCNGNDYNIVRDNRTFTPTRAFELIFSCRCGKQLFGDQIEEEYERQKAVYEAESVDRERDERDRIARERREEERLEAMRQAMLYQQRYREEKRRKVEEEEAARKAEEDRRWRAKVEALRGTDPAAAEAAVRAEDLRRAAAAAAAPKPPPAPKPAAPKKKAAPTAPVLNEDDEDYDEDAANGPQPGDADFHEDGHPQKCAFRNCHKAKRKNSKYCSRNCSNKNARARHKARSGKKGPDDASVAA